MEKTIVAAALLAGLIALWATMSSGLSMVTADIATENVTSCSGDNRTEIVKEYQNCLATYRACTQAGNCTTADRATYTACVKNARIQLHEIINRPQVCSDKGMRIYIKSEILNKIYEIKDPDYQCSSITSSSTLVVICDSNHDGNGDGVCQAGESCVSFIFNRYGHTQLVRNSNSEFSDQDASFIQRPTRMEVREWEKSYY